MKPIIEYAVTTIIGKQTKYLVDHFDGPFWSAKPETTYKTPDHPNLLWIQDVVKPNFDNVQISPVDIRPYLMNRLINQLRTTNSTIAAVNETAKALGLSTYAPFAIPETPHENLS